MARRPRQQPPTTPAAERIQRLAKALGTGPHAADINLQEHIRFVLQAIGDEDALALLETDLRKAA